MNKMLKRDYPPRKQEDKKEMDVKKPTTPTHYHFKIHPQKPHYHLSDDNIGGEIFY